MYNWWYCYKSMWCCKRSRSKNWQITTEVSWPTAVTEKTNHIVAIICKTFQHFDKTTPTNLYKTYVRPVIEYGNVIWGPQYIFYQQEVEKVQRRATKLINDLQDRTYDGQLTVLNLPSLQYHRKRGDMIMAYQLLHYNLDLGTSELFTFNPYQ